MESRTADSRHGVIAEDAVRVCFILPKSMVADIRSFVDKASRPTMSAVAREFMAIGIEKENRKNGQSAQDQSSSNLVQN